MNKIFSIGAAGVVFCVAGLAHEDAIAQTAPPKAIGVVMDRFQDSIRTKDKEQFLSLFLDPGRATWQPVNGDAVLEKRRKTNSKSAKAKSDANANPVSFIDSVCSRSEATEETFSNIRADANADAAAISFDYSFKLNGRVTNTGTEHWLLVRADQGWRITSIIWSIEALES